MASDISIEEVRDWLLSPVTQEFFSYVDLHYTDMDISVHKSLEAGELENAALCNAAMRQIEEIKDIPSRMKERVKDED